MPKSATLSCFYVSFICKIDIGGLYPSEERIKGGIHLKSRDLAKVLLRLRTLDGCINSVKVFGSLLHTAPILDFINLDINAFRASP